MSAQGDQRHELFDEIFRVVLLMELENLIGGCLEHRVPHWPLQLGPQFLQGLLNWLSQDFGAIVVHKIEQS